MTVRRHKEPIEKIVGMERIEELIFECRGRLSYVAKKLDVSSQTVYEMRDRNPEIPAMIERARDIAREDRIDDCEMYTETIAERYEEDTTNGLKAAMYCLNTHGKSRGWGKQEGDVDTSVTSMEIIKGLLQKQNAK